MESSNNYCAALQRVLATPAPLQNSPEWLAWRRSRLTASDAHKITGNAVKTRQSLIEEKVGRKQVNFGGNEYTISGHENEIVAVRRFEDLTGMQVVTDLPPVEHRLYPRLAASLDGMTTCGVNVEIKCLHTRPPGKPFKKPKGMHVQQANFQMACAEVNTTCLVYYYPYLKDAQGRPLLAVHELRYDHAWFTEKLPKFLGFIADLDEEMVNCLFDPLQIETDCVSDSDVEPDVWPRDPFFPLSDDLRGDDACMWDAWK